MATPAKQDFERFVGWLYQKGENIPPDVRRLANLSLANFDSLAATYRQHSSRSIYLVDLVRQSLTQVTDQQPPAPAPLAHGAWPWTRLRHLTVGPFRGFCQPEPFDLQKQIVLSYGPNGSGKSSFCEALEYALLGDVEEAGVKRIAALAYLENAHVRRFASPILKATDASQQEVAVIANSDLYRFCFIDKNRIDAFSRMAARPAGQRTELIATLFGMDQFNDFVSHFNESIDGQLVLTAPKQIELNLRRTALSQDQSTVAGGDLAHSTLRDEEAKLAESFATGMSYAGLKQLIGSADNPGRLHELDGLLNVIPPAIIGVTRQSLLDSLEKAHRFEKILDDLTTQIQARTDQVSFQELFTAVLALQKTTENRCPACDTPLDGPLHVSTDPYEKASQGLEQLRELGLIQERKRIAQEDVSRVSRELRHTFGLLELYIDERPEQVLSAVEYLAGLSKEPPDNWWTSIYPPTPPEAGFDEHEILEQLIVIADRIEAQDNASRQIQQEREVLVAERQRLIALQLKVQQQDQKEEALKLKVSHAQDRIDAFDIANANLIAGVEREEAAIARDTPYKTMYDRFLKELKEYRRQLPGQLMAGLNEAALTLYNEFNQRDIDVDKLANLYLPLTGEDKIEITFRGSPQQKQDALHILSEGHIRCLGLAILLAKARSIQSPLIIFDDAINAIDHDHRRGIRETIFESDHFPQTQFIVTCHSSEFIKDIQQQLPVQRRQHCQVYLFRNHDGNYQPRVTGNVGTRNEIAKARAALEALNDRDALSASRRSLEMLCNKVWQWLGYFDLGMLAVPVPGAGAEPALRNLCDAILKKLKDASTFNHLNKDPLIEALGLIAGIPADNLVWTYLNKGTHEKADSDDFDSECVELVVQALEKMDSLDLRRPR